MERFLFESSGIQWIGQLLGQIYIKKGNRLIGFYVSFFNLKLEGTDST